MVCVNDAFVCRGDDGQCFFARATLPAFTQVVAVGLPTCEFDIADPVENLNAVLNGTTTNPMNKKPVAGFKVTGTIKRTDFGIGANFPAGMLSDDVALDANTEFVKG